MSPIGWPFTDITGAAAITSPLTEPDGRRNQTRAIPGWVGAISVCWALAVGPHAQSANTPSDSPRNMGIARRYAHMVILSIAAGAFTGLSPKQFVAFGAGFRVKGGQPW